MKNQWRKHLLITAFLLLPNSFIPIFGCGSSGDVQTTTGVHVMIEIGNIEELGIDLDQAVEQTAKAFKKQFKEFGIRGSKVERIGVRNISIKIPVRAGTDPQSVIDFLGFESKLELTFVKNREETSDILAEIDRSISQSSLLDTVPKRDRPFLDLLLDSEVTTRLGGIAIPSENIDTYRQLINTAVQEGMVPDGASIALSQDPVILEGNIKCGILYVLDEKPCLIGSHISKAKMEIDRDFPDRYMVALKFSDDGSRIFRNLTGQNIGRHLAIVLNGEVVSAPVIQTRIPTGRAVITGSFSQQEASDIAIILNAKKHMAPFNIVETSVIEYEIRKRDIQGRFRE